MVSILLDARCSCLQSLMTLLNDAVQDCSSKHSACLQSVLSGVLQLAVVQDQRVRSD